MIAQMTFFFLTQKLVLCDKIKLNDITEMPMKKGQSFSFSVPRVDSFFLILNTPDNIEINSTIRDVWANKYVTSTPPPDSRAIGYFFRNNDGTISIRATEDTNLTFGTIIPTAKCQDLYFSTYDREIFRVGNDLRSNATFRGDRQICFWHAVPGPFLVDAKCKLPLLYSTFELYDADQLTNSFAAEMSTIISESIDSFPLFYFHLDPFYYWQFASIESKTTSGQSVGIKIASRFPEGSSGFIFDRNPKRPSSTIARKSDMTPNSIPTRETKRTSLSPLFVCLIFSLSLSAALLIMRHKPHNNDDEERLLQKAEDSIPPFREAEDI